MKGQKEFKQAALWYMGLKVGLIGLTYLFMECRGCEGSNASRQLLHLVLTSHFIYAGMRITSSIIGFICFFRGLSYALNFFMKKTFLLSLSLTGMSLAVLEERGGGNWLFLVHSVIMLFVAFMIFRAVRARFAHEEMLQPAAVNDSSIPGIMS